MLSKLNFQQYLLRKTRRSSIISFSKKSLNQSFTSIRSNQFSKMTGLPTSYGFPILNLISLMLVYSKVEGELFFWSWTAVLTPTMLSLIIVAAQNFFTLVTFDPSDTTALKEYSSLKLHFIKSMFNVIFSIFGFLIVYVFGALKDKVSNQINNSHGFALVACILVAYIVYSVWVDQEARKAMIPSAMQEAHSGFKNRLTACLSAMVAPIMNFLGASMVICSGGACTTIYGSTISAIFGAFGVSATNWLPFLDWLTAIIVLVSVYVVYTAKYSVKYPPFLLSAAGAVCILSNMLFFTARYLIWAGNVLMILSAYLNYRLNVPSMFKRKAKSSNSSELKEVV